MNEITRATRRESFIKVNVTERSTSTRNIKRWDRKNSKGSSRGDVYSRLYKYAR